MHEPFHHDNTASRLAFLDNYDSKEHCQPQGPVAQLHHDCDRDSIASESESDETGNGIMYLVSHQSTIVKSDSRTDAL